MSAPRKFVKSLAKPAHARWPPYTLSLIAPRATVRRSVAFRRSRPIRRSSNNVLDSWKFARGCQMNVTPRRRLDHLDQQRLPRLARPTSNLPSSDRDRKPNPRASDVCVRERAASPRALRARVDAKIRCHNQVDGQRRSRAAEAVKRAPSQRHYRPAIQLDSHARIGVKWSVSNRYLRRLFRMWRDRKSVV